MARTTSLLGLKNKQFHRMQTLNMPYGGRIRMGSENAAIEFGQFCMFFLRVWPLAVSREEPVEFRSSWNGNVPVTQAQVIVRAFRASQLQMKSILHLGDCTTSISSRYDALFVTINTESLLIMYLTIWNDCFRRFWRCKLILFLFPTLLVAFFAVMKRRIVKGWNLK